MAEAKKKTTTKKSAKAETAKAETAKAEKPAPAKKKAEKSTKVSNGRALVVVESPAKAKTIKKYLGAGFTVKASVGHVMDLPKSKMGVDVEHVFAPEYVVIRGKGKIVAELKAAAKGADRILLATDP